MTEVTSQQVDDATILEWAAKAKHYRDLANALPIDEYVDAHDALKDVADELERQVMNSTSMSPLVVAERLEFMDNVSHNFSEYTDYEHRIVRQGIEVLRAIAGN